MAVDCILPLPNTSEERERHLACFETYFLERQRAYGLAGDRLMSVERAIVLAHVAWLAEVYTKESADARHQADGTL